MSAKREVSHVSMAGNVMLCEHCGGRQPLALPQTVESAVGLMRAWSKAHRNCRATPGASAFRFAASLRDWPESDDTGMSSKALYRHMSMGPAFAEDFRDRFAHFPHDPSDFGRCYRLLQLAPPWRERIAEMAQHGPEWAALAGAWDELTALYEEEVGPSHRGSAPKLYARMKELTEVAAVSLPGDEQP